MLLNFQFILVPLLASFVRLAIVFVIIGGFHLIFRKKFTQLSDFYLGHSLPIKQQKLWDFLFYSSFGIIIIESVKIAGVLTVFAFLILPASISALFSTTMAGRIWSLQGTR